MTAWLAENLGIHESTAGRLVATLVTLAAVFLVRWLVIRAVHRNVEHPESEYRIRKGTTYISTAIIFLAVVQIWSSAIGSIGTFLGLLSAGIAIALADVFLNLAGWVYVVTRRPFKVGDRVEIDGQIGDVVDVRVFRFTLLELRSWIDADQSTGRLVHIPNGLLFKLPLANYTEGFRHIWHEVPVLVTFESDWEKAESLIEAAMVPFHMSEEEMHVASEFRRAARRYFIQQRDLAPTVYVSARDSGVLLTARLLIHPRERRKVEDGLWRAILKAFAEEPTIELAYPTWRTFRGPEGSGS